MPVATINSRINDLTRPQTCETFWRECFKYLGWRVVALFKSGQNRTTRRQAAGPARQWGAVYVLCAAAMIGLGIDTAQAAKDPARKDLAPIASPPGAATTAIQRIDDAHKRSLTRTPFKAKDAHIDDDTVNEPWIVSTLMVGGLEHDIIGACSAPCDRIEMQISDPEGKPLAVEEAEAPFAIFTLTPPQDGHFKIRLRAVNCPQPARSCPVAYAVFRAKDTSPPPPIAPVAPLAARDARPPPLPEPPAAATSPIVDPAVQARIESVVGNLAQFFVSRAEADRAKASEPPLLAPSAAITSDRATGRPRDAAQAGTPSTTNCAELQRQMLSELNQLRGPNANERTQMLTERFKIACPGWAL